MAAALFRGEPPQTLQPTALVHEAYRKLASNGAMYESESHFLAVAATAMRQILVDRARARGRQKRGGVENANRALGGAGGHWEVAFGSADGITPDELLSLEDAMIQLERIDARKSRIIELRFFAGMSVLQVADVLGISPTTVKSEWRFARAWLGAKLSVDQDT